MANLLILIAGCVGTWLCFMINDWLLTTSNKRIKTSVVVVIYIVVAAGAIIQLC